MVRNEDDVGSTVIHATCEEVLYHAPVKLLNVVASIVKASKNPTEYATTSSRRAFDFVGRRKIGVCVKDSWRSLLCDAENGRRGMTVRGEGRERKIDECDWDYFAVRVVENWTQSVKCTSRILSSSGRRI